MSDPLDFLNDQVPKPSAPRKPKSRSTWWMGLAISLIMGATIGLGVSGWNPFLKSEKQQALDYLQTHGMQDPEILYWDSVTPPTSGIFAGAKWPKDCKCYLCRYRGTTFMQGRIENGDYFCFVDGVLWTGENGK